MLTNRLALVLSLSLVAFGAGCASATADDDGSAASAAAETSSSDASPALAALQGLELVALLPTMLPDGPNGSVGATGIYINLETPVRLAHGSASFIECDLSIAQPTYFESKTDAISEGEAFTIATVSDVTTSGSRTDFTMEALRSWNDATQMMDMTCHIGGMSPMAYVTDSSMLIRHLSR